MNIRLGNVDRNIKDSYKNVLSWAELILNNLAPINWHGKQDTVSLLFPMEKVFEYYVTHKLKKYFASSGYGLSFKTQSSEHKVMKENVDNVSFTIKPDMIAEGDNHCFIMDTKWKVLNQKSGGNKEKYGISQSDIYQLYSYGKVYQREFTKKGEDKHTALFLLYPRNDNFKEVITFVEDDSKSADENNSQNLILKIIPVDLPDLEDTKRIIDDICIEHGIHKKPSAA